MMYWADWLLFASSFVVVTYAEERRHFSRRSEDSWRGSLKTKTCSSDQYCDVTMGYACHWLFDGCQVGQCMCDPRKHRRLPSGKCVSVKFGDEKCDGNYVCVEGMTCEGGWCKCQVGVQTLDGEHCLRRHHRLLGQQCDVTSDVCYQKAVNGYTKSGVFCSENGFCVCEEGSRSNGLTCRNLRIHERGCTKFYHCEGGAVCVDRRCVCPNGYTSSIDGTKCVKKDAIKDLPFGFQCDEINERRYCGYGLVCHRCSDADTTYRCVRCQFLQTFFAERCRVFVERHVVYDPSFVGYCCRLHLLDRLDSSKTCLDFTGFHAQVA